MNAEDLHPGLEFDAADLQVLERAAVLADLVEELRADVRERGRVVEGSTGRSMTNPSIDKIARLQTSIARMVKLVRLDAEPARTRHLNRRQRNVVRDLAREAR
jgi:hypothetical protein